LWVAGGFDLGQKMTIIHTKRTVTDENISVCRSVTLEQVVCGQNLQQPVDGEQQ
jgi:hypothetical protein